MGDYNPKAKGLPSAWRGMQRRLPKTWGTFQIVILAGVLSLLILRSTIGFVSINFAGRLTAGDDEYASDEQSRLLEGVDGEPKRNLVQKASTDRTEKFGKNPRREAEVEFDDEMDEEEQQLEDLRAVTGNGVKNANEEKLRKTAEVDEKKPISRPKEQVVENFLQVEAQLAEEETADELAEFEEFQKGKDQQEQQLPTMEPKAKKETVVEKATGKEKSAEQKLTSKKEMPGEEKKSKESKVNEKVEDSATEKKPEMTPQQLEAFTKEALANMSKILRRDDPNAFTLGPKISDWDEQRAAWLEKNPDMKITDPHKPRVLLLTGSQPLPCTSTVGDHYLLKMIKNKVDYARIHKLEIFYSLAHLDKAMSDFWAKLPIIRKMMLMRPEVEWMFWMDSDAMFTDMVFEIPFERYQDYNVVLWGTTKGIYDERSWVACNTGVMFLRNNQWTLDLLEEMSHMGPEGEIRMEAGKILTSYLTRRPVMMADDQSALVFLLLTRPELRPKVGLEDEYYLSGYWKDLVDKYEEFSQTSKPGAGGHSWPFATHFTGCQPCSGANNELYLGNTCLEGMERAFNFADNQVLKSFGFEHESLYGSNVLRVRNETTKPIFSVPVDNPWAVQSFYT